MRSSWTVIPVLFIVGCGGVAPKPEVIQVSVAVATQDGGMSPAIGDSGASQAIAVPTSRDAGEIFGDGIEGETSGVEGLRLCPPAPEPCDGAGGSGVGIGLGNFGGLGQDRGARRNPDGGTPPPRMREAEITVRGRLPKEVVKRVVRRSFGQFRACYASGLRSNASLRGRIATEFRIDPKGEVVRVAVAGSTVPHYGVVACVVGAYRGLIFPRPEGGVVDVLHAIDFELGE